MKNIEEPKKKLLKERVVLDCKCGNQMVVIKGVFIESSIRCGKCGEVSQVPE